MKQLSSEMQKDTHISPSADLSGTVKVNGDSWPEDPTHLSEETTLPAAVSVFYFLIGKKTKKIFNSLIEYILDYKM